MRWLRRWPFRLLGIGCVLLSVAACVTWFGARRGGTGRLGVLTPGGRYALRFDRDRLRLIGPPPVMPADREAKAWDLAGRIRNADLGWSIPGRMVISTPSTIPGTGAPHGRLLEGFVSQGGVLRYPRPLEHFYYPDRGKAQIPFDALRRPLLRAMEDPDRWLVAHYLAWREGPWTSWRTSVPLPPPEGNVFVHDLAGVRVELPVPDPHTPRRPTHADSERFSWVYRVDLPPLARIDPSQRTRIRDMWHDRLGITVAAVPYWLLVLPGLAPPLTWLRRKARAAVRGGRGLCRQCGYDVRASPERCPECGASRPAAAGEHAERRQQQ